MKQSYALIRTETLAWLLEALRAVPTEDRPPIPVEVAQDLREVVQNVEAPRPELDRVRGAGPVLSYEQHLDLLADAAEELGLPINKHDGAFWRLVARVTHKMLENEGEAILRVIGEER